MKKTEHTKREYTLDIIARTESGRIEVSIGLEDLGPGERKFLFDALRRTTKGGGATLGLHETGPGEKTLSLLLKEPIPVDTAVKGAIVSELQRTTH